MFIHLNISNFLSPIAFLILSCIKDDIETTMEEEHAKQARNVNEQK